MAEVNTCDFIAINSTHELLMSIRCKNYSQHYYRPSFSVGQSLSVHCCFAVSMLCCVSQ